jgi:hypothetical protein
MGRMLPRGRTVRPRAPDTIASDGVFYAPESPRLRCCIERRTRIICTTKIRSIIAFAGVTF